MSPDTAPNTLRSAMLIALLITLAACEQQGNSQSGVDPNNGAVERDLKVHPGNSVVASSAEKGTTAQPVKQQEAQSTVKVDKWNYKKRGP